MADKPKVDIAMLFGKPKGGDAAMGDDKMSLAKTIFDDTLDVETRAEALHEYVMACQAEEAGEPPGMAEADEAEGY